MPDPLNWNDSFTCLSPSIGMIYLQACPSIGMIHSHARPLNWNDSFKSLIHFQIRPIEWNNPLTHIVFMVGLRLVVVRCLSQLNDFPLRFITGFQSRPGKNLLKLEQCITIQSPCKLIETGTVHCHSITLQIH